MEPEQPQPPAEQESGSAQKEHLDALLESWDSLEQPGGMNEADLARASRRWQVDSSRLWITLGLAMIALAGWSMWLTRHEVAYWMQRGQEPRDLGSLGERFKSGERDLDIPSNIYVSAREIFSSYEAEGELARGGEVELQRFYLDPLFNIVVRTTRPTPDKPYHRAASISVPEGFLEILEKRKAFPYDLVVPIDVTGRLLRATMAPRWHRKPLRYFASVARLDPEKMWLLLEDDPPENYGMFALFWGVAISLIVSSAVLVAWAIRRRRRVLA
ncbi:MAG: hypothetical protein VX938_02585 [Myxococcota bacterium]|nr:hypothetical protein [Myxococcota bacterium]MEE2779463.1 hypothetical protein [Myxococcota bacterium]